jgi:hypothetical protein
MMIELPPLTRRPDPHREDCWLIYAGDIHAGAIARAAGTPNAIVRWKWSAGFYPGSGAGEIKSGTADTFDQARAAFKEAWRDFLAKRTTADLKEWRDQRDFTANKRCGPEVPLRDNC